MDDIRLTEIEGSVRANPYDRRMVDRFFDAYEKAFGGEHGPTGHGIDPEKLKMEYLVLKYLHSDGKWTYLNLLGEYFIAQGKYLLARICLSESLRSNPPQPAVFRLLDDIEGRAKCLRLPEDSPREDIVSVIMCTYNKKREILESIRSVLGQSFGNFELIIVNDGGADDAEQIVRSLNSGRIRYHKTKENKGHAAALNVGIGMARGKYIAYLDDDDVYYPNHLECLHAAVHSSKRKFVYSGTRFVRGSVAAGGFKEEGVIGTWNEKHDKNRLISENYIANLSVLQDKSLFVEAGLFSPELNVVMDWELWLRFSLDHDFHHLDVVTGDYRYTGSNITKKDRLLIDFHTEMIQRHYAGYRGKIASAKYFMSAGCPEKGRDLFFEIKSAYDGYFKSAASCAELIPMAGTFNDRDFAKRVALDYFEIDPRGCMEYVRRSRSLRTLCTVLPSMPEKIRKSLRARIHSGKN